MVLVSHRYKFIYISSFKTASSSTCSFFEKFCVSPEEQKNYVHKDEIDSVESEYGIRGLRFNGKGKWNNHTSLFEIKDRLGEKIFVNYFKFTNIRNPWDRIVSEYFYHSKRDLPSDVSFEQYVMNHCKINRTGQLYTEVNEKNGKRRYLCDFYIRYEHLKEDIISVCKLLGIPEEDYANIDDELPEFRTEYREHDRDGRKFHYSTYYNEKTRNKVAELYKDDIEKFGYVF